jgi:hypothetical protein
LKENGESLEGIFMEVVEGGNKINWASMRVVFQEEINIGLDV